MCTLCPTPSVQQRWSTGSRCFLLAASYLPRQPSIVSHLAHSTTADAISGLLPTHSLEALPTNVITNKAPTDSPTETLHQALHLSARSTSTSPTPSSQLSPRRCLNSDVRCLILGVLIIAVVWLLSFKLHRIISLGIGTFGPVNVHVDYPTYISHPRQRTRGRTAMW